MTYPAPDELSSAERAFVSNATEVDILPGVWGDLPDPLASGPASDLAPILLSLVDRGWIRVCRLVRWSSPDGTAGFQPGPFLPRESLPALLADAGNWEYPEDGEWLGRITLILTDAGQQVPR